jgi:glycosyltransferase involved in cell wall biosynthesis
MKRQPLLSICIATYNRARFIGETLESIIAQVTDEVEIIVVDGASTDDTADVMRKYQERCSYLRYHRMPTKGGVDQDYCHAVSFAKGDYCWLLTDDDIVKPGAINAILDRIQHKYSLIVVNAEVRDRSLSHLIESKLLKLDHDTVYQPAAQEDLFIDTVTYLSFIGAVVIDRSLWIEREKETYLGTEFVHIGIIFQKTLPHGACVISEPYISIRYGNAQWSSRYLEVWMLKWPQLIWSFSGISETAKSRIGPREPWNSMRALLLMRASGAYSIHEYGKFIEPRLDSRWDRFIAKTAALLPGSIPNLLAVIYFTLKTSQDFMLWHGLRTSRFYYREYLRRIVTTLGKPFLPGKTMRN